MWFLRDQMFFLWLGLASQLLKQVASSNFAIRSAPSEEVSSSDLKYIDEKFSTCNGINIREITITQVQQLFTTHQLSSLQLTKCYLRRITKMNPYLHAVIETNPLATLEAIKADIERLFGLNRSPLHGIPVLVKDSIAVNYGMQTTAGSKALINHFPKEDADVVKALKKAGAIILGKANLAEFSGIRGIMASSRGGQTESAYNTSTNPLGSSSGSAVGISANLAMVSLGAETLGSLITPASLAGIFALKPTLGLISTTGVIPISHNQDCVGPMARTVEDLAFLLYGMGPKYQLQIFNSDGSYLKNRLGSEYPSKLRIGVMRHPYWNTTFERNTELIYQLPYLEGILRSMQSSPYFEVVDYITTPESIWQGPASQNESFVLAHDFKYGINEYLKNFVVHIPKDTEGSNSSYHGIKSLKNLIQYFAQFPDGASVDFFEQAESTDGIHNQTYLKALESKQQASKLALSWGFVWHDIDALVFPNPIRYGSIPTNSRDGGSSTKFVSGISLAAVSGYPSLNVPAGIDRNGVPYGMTLVGKPNTEEKLLQAGYYMEKLNPARQPPRFLS